MKFNKQYLKTLILKQISEVFHANRFNFWRVPKEVDAAMLKQKAVVLSGPYFTNSTAELSLSTMIALELFDEQGNLNIPNQYQPLLDISPELQACIDSKWFGKLSDIQTIALEVFIGELYSQLVLTLEPHRDYIEQEANKKVSRYVQLQQSLSSLHEIKRELRNYLSLLIEFMPGDLLSLELTLVSKTRLTDSLQKIGGPNNNISVVIPVNISNDISYLSIEQLLPILSQSKNSLNIINLESLAIDDIYFGGLNYFIPDEQGNVLLPNEFSPLTATSKLVNVIDRIHVYQVKFSSQKKVQVSHFPWKKGDVTLSENELNYLFFQSKTQAVRTLLHGHYGSELFHKIVLSHTDATVLDMDKEKLSIALGGDISNISLEFMANAPLQRENVNVDYTFRLFRETLDFLSFENEKKLEQNFNHTLLKRQLQLNNFKQSINNYIFPSVTALQMDGLDTQLDLASNLFVERQKKLDDFFQYDLYWLVEFILLSDTVDGTKHTQDLKILSKHIVSKDELIKNYSYLIAINITLKNLVIDKDEGWQYLNKVFVVLENIAKKTDELVATSSCLSVHAVYLKKTYQLISDSLEIFNEKYWSVALPKIESLNERLRNLLMVSRALGLVLVENNNKFFMLYQSAKSIESKFNKAFTLIKRNKSKPYYWLGLLKSFSVKEKEAAGLYPGALMPCMEYLKSLSEKKKFNDAIFIEAKNLFLKGISELKENLVMSAFSSDERVFHDAVSLDDPIVLWKVNNELTANFIPELEVRYDMQLLAKDAVHQEMLIEKFDTYKKRPLFLSTDYPTPSASVLGSLIDNKYISEMYLGTEVDRCVSNLTLDFSEVSLWGRENLTVAQSDIITRSLEPTVMLYQKTRDSDEKRILKLNYKEKLCSELDHIYFDKIRSFRFDEMKRDILLSTYSYDLNMKNTESKYLLNIRSTLPFFIMVHIELFKIDVSGEINSEQLREWLRICKTAGAKIVLFDDGIEKSPVDVCSYLLKKQVVVEHVVNGKLVNSDGEIEALKLLSLKGFFSNDRSKHLFIAANCFFEKNSNKVSRFVNNNFTTELVSLSLHSSFALERALQELAYRYDFQLLNEQYFNNEISHPTLNVPFLFSRQGFKSTLMVSSVSIESFISKINQFYEFDVNRIRGVSGSLSLEQRRNYERGLSAFFNDRQHVFNNPNIGGLLAERLTRGRYYYDNHMGSIFSEGVLFLLKLFKEDCLTLSFFEIDLIFHKIFHAYLKITISSKEALNQWMVSEFSKQLAILNLGKEKKEKINHDIVENSALEATHQFILSAINNNAEIALADQNLSMDNLVYLEGYFEREIDKSLSLFSDFYKLVSLSVFDIEKTQSELNKILTLVYACLEKGIGFERVHLVKAYQQLSLYKKVLFPIKGRGHGAAFLRQISTVFLRNHKKLFEETKSELNLLNIETLNINDFFIENKTFIDSIGLHLASSAKMMMEYFNFLLGTEIMSWQEVGTITIAIVNLRENIDIYIKDFSGAELVDSFHLLGSIFAILTESAKDNLPVLKVLLDKWDEKWTVEYRAKMLCFVHNQINIDLLSLESKFRQLKDLTHTESLSEELSFITSIVCRFNTLFGRSFYEYRLARLQYLSQLKVLPFPWQKNSKKIKLTSKHEQKLLELFFNRMSDSEALLGTPELLETEGEAENLSYKEHKVEFSKNVLTNYFQIFKNDVLDSLNINFIDVFSVQDLMVAVFMHINAKVDKSSQLKNCSKISFLIDNLIKLNFLCKSLLGTEVIKSENLHNLNQKVSLLFLEQLRNNICYKTSAYHWNFTLLEMFGWVELGYILQSVGHKRVSYPLPAEVSKQYNTLVEFLSSKHDEGESVLFRHQMLALSDDIQIKLPEPRRKTYASFFQHLASDQEHVSSQNYLDRTATATSKVAV